MLLDITVPPDITELRRLRRLSAAWLDDGLDPGPLQLVVTELVTNAIEASTDLPVRLRLSEDDDGVTLVVEDHGPGIADREIGPVPAHHPRGRGLYIVSQIAELDLRRDPGVTRVTARMPVAQLRRTPVPPPHHRAGVST